MCVDVIGHVGSWPHVRSFGPLARQIPPRLSASVSRDARMLWSVVPVCVFCVSVHAYVAWFGESLCVCMCVSV